MDDDTFAEVDAACICSSCGKGEERCGCNTCEVCAWALKPEEREDGLCFQCNKGRLWAEAAKTNACCGCGCKPEDECPCDKVCDEGDCCERHAAEEYAYWKRQFRGYTRDNPPPGVQSDAELAEVMAEARLLK